MARRLNRTLQFREACGFWVRREYERAKGLFRELLASEQDDPRFARYWLASGSDFCSTTSTSRTRRVETGIRPVELRLTRDAF